MTERPTTGAARSDRLAHAEAEVEQARERVSASVLALRDELARQAAAKRRLAGWNGSAADYIRERPGRCLLGALALGFIIGKIARRA